MYVDMTVGQRSARKLDETRECRIQLKVCAESNVIYEQLATSGPRPATGTEPLAGSVACACGTVQYMCESV